MAASRAARKREMIANLENEEYLNDLANESYAIIFTQSTTNTVAQKKVKKTNSSWCSSTDFALIYICLEDSARRWRAIISRGLHLERVS